MASFLTLKSPFCKYELAKQDDTDTSDDNSKQPSKLAAVGNSIKENSQIEDYDVSCSTLFVLFKSST